MLCVCFFCFFFERGLVPWRNPIGNSDNTQVRVGEEWDGRSGMGVL